MPCCALCVYALHAARYKAETAAGASEVKDHVLDDATDEVWAELRHAHIAGAPYDSMDVRELLWQQCASPKLVLGAVAFLTAQSVAPTRQRSMHTSECMA